MHNLQKRLLSSLSKQDFVGLTLRQIGKEIGLKEPINPQKVKHHLDQLEKKGLIRQDRKKQRVTRIEPGSNKGNDFYNIPIYGEANCGEATIYSEEHLQGYLKVSKSYIRPLGSVKELFALKAVGNSMNDSHVHVIGKPNERAPIQDGDYIIINGNDREPTDGKYILSIIDNCANVKKLSFQSGGEAILISESIEDFAPIFIHESDHPDFFINGTVVGVLKTRHQKIT